MLETALRDLSSGKPVLLYDSDSREQETDMIVSAREIEPSHIATLRREAGGLICLAVPGDVADLLGLPYLHRIYEESKNAAVRGLASDSMPYGGPPAFSVSLNHRDNFTGITDLDRAQTAREFCKLVALVQREPSAGCAQALVENFRSPGHLPLLIASNIGERQGHTELSIRLAGMSGIVPAVVICEMLDDRTHRALSKGDAQEYARRHGLAMLEASDVLGGSEVDR